MTETEGRYPAPFEAEALSCGRDLGHAAGSRALGAWRERLPPGRRTSFPHAHLRQEELVYVLCGAPSLRIIGADGAREEVLAPGDFVAFPAGTGIAHAFVNRSEADCELLVVGERTMGERTAYPEDPAFGAWLQQERPHRAWTDVNAAQGGAIWPPARIETEHLVMRPWAERDVPDLLALQVRNTAHLLPFMPWAQAVPTPDEHAERVRGWMTEAASGGDVVLGVMLADGALVGGTGIHGRIGPFGRELGYWVSQEHEGKGYVTEWCTALVRLCFEVLSMDRVEIHCDPKNARSAAVALRMGFKHEATLRRRAVGVDGKPRDTAIYALYADDEAAAATRSASVRAIDALGRRLL